MVDQIGPIQNSSPIQPIEPQSNASAGRSESKQSFKEVLKKSIQEVNKLQHEADQAIQQLALGERDDYARVITAVEKADIAFKTLLEVRNKLIDAYQEFNRMRI